MLINAILIILTTITVLQWMILVVDTLMHDDTDCIVDTKLGMLMLIIPGGSLIIIIGTVIEKFMLAPWK